MQNLCEICHIAFTTCSSSPLLESKSVTPTLYMEAKMLVTLAFVLIAWLIAGVGLAWMLGRAADLGSADDVRLQKEDFARQEHIDLAPVHGNHR
jgi:hypothetical protein